DPDPAVAQRFRAGRVGPDEVARHGRGIAEFFVDPVRKVPGDDVAVRGGRPADCVAVAADLHADQVATDGPARPIRAQVVASDGDVVASCRDGGPGGEVVDDQSTHGDPIGARDEAVEGREYRTRAGQDDNRAARE